MKITIKLDMPEKTASDAPDKPTLKERVEYANWCLESGHHPAAALQFLRKAKDHLEAKHPFEQEDSDLLRLIQSGLMDFGHY
jgi:hypothetical protein